MVYGAPVVSSNTTALPEVYEKAAWYFDPEDTLDMADKIGHVLDDEVLRKELIKNGANQVKWYSWRKMAEQTHTVYMKALEQ